MKPSSYYNRNSVSSGSSTIRLWLAACCLCVLAAPSLGQDAVGSAEQMSASVSKLGSAANSTSGRTDTIVRPGLDDAVSGYRLGVGDKVQVTVYGEDDLSGSFDVDGSGNVRLPLIDQVRAQGLTLKEFEQAIEAKLRNGYLLKPRVNVSVTNYRPFSILGEVNKPGEYPYENGMTVLNAVAIGGGYTYRANKDDVYIRRKGSSTDVEMPADNSTYVFPGDTVTVEERLF